MDIVRNTFLLPTLKLDDQKFEFIFLLDTSSSMRGRKIELAKKALKLILHSLPSTCYFNIITFNSRINIFFPGSVRYNESNLEAAKKLVDDIRTGTGTNIFLPLQHVYNQRQIRGYLTQIFSITDGCVANRDKVLKLVKSKATHSRSFSLGIGNSADQKLVIKLAENAGGMHEFVTYDEQIESKILHQLKIAQKPALLKPIRLGPAQLILDEAPI